MVTPHNSHVFVKIFLLSLNIWKLEKFRHQKKCLNHPEFEQCGFIISGIQEYKNLTWVWGAERKFRPEGHCFASRGFAEWCKTVIPRDGIFYRHRTLMFDSFSCIPFDFEYFFLKNQHSLPHTMTLTLEMFLKWRQRDVRMTWI